jgi:hypothetical protein
MQETQSSTTLWLTQKDKGSLWKMKLVKTCGVDSIIITTTRKAFLQQIRSTFPLIPFRTYFVFSSENNYVNKIRANVNIDR